MRQASVRIIITFVLTLFMTLLNPQTTMAAIDVYEFDSPQQEAQYRGLIAEFRCPKCQNQNLAGSDAPIAQDLKQKTYEMVKAGQTDAQIREYMYDRYGDFISYKPPVRPSTWILWFFPPVLLLLLIVGWVWRTKRQNMTYVTGDTNSQATMSVSNDTDVNDTDVKNASIDTIQKHDLAQPKNQADKGSTNEQISDSSAHLASQLSIQEQQALAALLATHDSTSEDNISTHPHKSDVEDKS